MQGINFEHRKGEGFRLTDFPDAEKFVALEGSKAQELADMSLHWSDLRRAEEYLDSSVAAEEGSVAQRALWGMAIINFFKCFGGNNARAVNLDISKIIFHDLGLEAYGFFKNLRDKNIAHDDNSITQCCVGAVISKADASRKVGKIVTMNVHGEMNGEGNVGNLRNLIKEALGYVEKRYDEICDELTKELERRSHADLVELPGVTYDVPGADDVSKNRGKV